MSSDAVVGSQPATAIVLTTNRTARTEQTSPIAPYYPFSDRAAPTNAAKRPASGFGGVGSAERIINEVIRWKVGALGRGSADLDIDERPWVGIRWSDAARSPA